MNQAEGRRSSSLHSLEVGELQTHLNKRIRTHVVLLGKLLAIVREFQNVQIQIVDCTRETTMSMSMDHRRIRCLRLKALFGERKVLFQRAAQIPSQPMRHRKFAERLRPTKAFAALLFPNEGGSIVLLPARQASPHLHILEEMLNQLNNRHRLGRRMFVVETEQAIGADDELHGLVVPTIRGVEQRFSSVQDLLSQRDEITFLAAIESHRLFIIIVVAVPVALLGLSLIQADEKDTPFDVIQRISIQRI